MNELCCPSSRPLAATHIRALPKDYLRPPPSSTHGTACSASRVQTVPPRLFLLAASTGPRLRLCPRIGPYPRLRRLPQALQMQRPAYPRIGTQIAPPSLSLPSNRNSAFTVGRPLVLLCHSIQGKPCRSQNSMTHDGLAVSARVSSRRVPALVPAAPRLDKATACVRGAAACAPQPSRQRCA